MESQRLKSGADERRPQLIIRLRFGHEEPEIWRRTFQQLAKCREICDEVWFSTGVGIYTLDEHRRLSALMASHAAELRDVGIIPSLQVQATLGHSDSATEQAGAPGKTWGSYVGRNGEQCRFINCPTQPAFLDYLEEMSRIYAAWHPGSVWIDDDLRPSNHRPASSPYGCYCGHCLELFGKREGRAFTREELVEGCERDARLSERWKMFVDDALCDVAERIARAFHAVSPETVMGLQHGVITSRVPIIKRLNEASLQRVGSRPGGGAYSDHYPYGVIHKADYLSLQMETQQGYDVLGQVCAEIESFPRTMCLKTAHGLRVESLLDLAIGMDSLSYFILDPVYETPEWYGNELLAPLASDAPCFREFIRHNRDAAPGGMGLCAGGAVPLEAPEALGLPLVGIPHASFSRLASCRMMNGVVAETLSDEELRRFLAEDIVLDGAAVDVLQRRGLGELVERIDAKPFTGCATFDAYTDEPFNDGLTGHGAFSTSDQRFAFTVPGGALVRVLCRYSDGHGRILGDSCVIMERPNGKRLALLGSDGFSTHVANSTRIRFLYRLVDWLSHGTLPALPTEPVQCMVVPNITQQGALRSVTALNVTMGFQKPFELKLRGVSADVSEAEWLVPSEAPVRLNVRHDASGESSVTLPALLPWGIGWLKI